MKCLDTTFFLDLLGRGGSNLKEQAMRLLFEDNGHPALSTTRFNVAELYLGVEMSRDPDRERQSVGNLLHGITILEFDDRSAIIYASIWARLSRLGTPIGNMDTLIASVAIANGATLVSRNVKHFSRIEMLQTRAY